MLPPEPDELMLLIYSFEALNASEETGKCKGGPNRPEGCPHTATLPACSRRKLQGPLLCVGKTRATVSRGVCCLAKATAIRLDKTHS
jgi:hypothetical protein